MRRVFVILPILLAYFTMSLLVVVPHHHHGSEVCFAVEQVEHTHSDCHHTHNDQPTSDDECSLSTILREALNGSNLRVVNSDVLYLPAWQCCCEECREAGLCVEHRHNQLIPNLYEAPDVRALSLRAPPAV